MFDLIISPPKDGAPRKVGGWVDYLENDCINEQIQVGNGFQALEFLGSVSSKGVINICNRNSLMHVYFSMANIVIVLSVYRSAFYA